MNMHHFFPLLLSIIFLVACGTAEVDLKYHPLIPIPVSAIDLKKDTVMDGSKLIMFSIADSPEEILTFYKSRLADSKWRLVRDDKNGLRYEYSPEFFSGTIATAITVRKIQNVETRVEIWVFDPSSKAIR